MPRCWLVRSWTENILTGVAVTRSSVIPEETDRTLVQGKQREGKPTVLWTPEASHAVSTDFERLRREERGKGQAPLIHLPAGCRRAAVRWALGEEACCLSHVLFLCSLKQRQNTEAPSPDTAATVPPPPSFCANPLLNKCSVPRTTRPEELLLKLPSKHTSKSQDLGTGNYWQQLPRPLAAHALGNPESSLFLKRRADRP